MSNSAQGTVLPGQPVAVTAGTGITINSTTGVISVNLSALTPLLDPFYVKLNSSGAYNAYVWPGVDGAAGTFLQTDGAGNLTWATASGFAVVTVSGTAPTPPDEGELWYDCSTGTLKVYQNCVAPGGWTDTNQSGLPVLPANTSAAPPFTGGNGTLATPYDCTVTTAAAGSSVFVVNTVTIVGLAPYQYVPIVDLNAVANGGRFTFSNYYANAAGSLTFQTIFKDQPSSPPATSYTAAIKVGYGSVYIDAIVNVVTPLSTTAGSIAGTPTTGSTLTYTTGVASGGSGGYTYAWIWKDSAGNTLQTGGPTYIIQAAEVGRTIEVVLTATDSSLTTATATTAPTAVVSTAPFPSGVWNPTPAGGLNTIPGGISATYSGAGPTVSGTGCIEISVAGGAYGQGPTPITSGQTLAARWIASSSCGNAATGSNLTGSVTDGTYQTNYAVTVNRKPTPAIANISDTNVGLGAVTTKATAAIAGLTATAYVTLGTGSTGTSIQISTDNVTYVTPPAAPSTAFPINNGDSLYIRQTVGTSTSIGYTAIVAIGDSTGTGGAGSTFQTVTYTATTVSSAIFPNTTFSPSTGPNAAPAAVNITGDPQLGNLKGTATGTWNDGTVTLTATNMLLGVGAAPTLTSITPSNTQTVNFAWDPTYLSGLATGATASGSFTDGTFTNSYTMVVDKATVWTAPTAASGAAGAISIGIQTPTSYNVPVKVYQTVPGSNAITSVTVDINGAGPVALPTSAATALIINPGETIAFAGTAPVGTGTYTTAINIGDTQQTWSYQVTVTPTVSTPSITTPATSGPFNPAVNSPAGITIGTVGPGSPGGFVTNYGGTQTKSQWYVYKANPTNPTTSAITGVGVGPTYSANLTSSNGFSQPASNAFNGNTTSAAESNTVNAPTGVATLTWTPASAISATSLRVYALIGTSAGVYSHEISINGGAFTDMGVSGGAVAAWYDVTALAGGSVTSIRTRVTVLSGAAGATALYAVEVNGGILTDGATVLTLTDATDLASMVVGDVVKQGNATGPTTYSSGVVFNPVTPQPIGGASAAGGFDGSLTSAQPCSVVANTVGNSVTWTASPTIPCSTVRVYCGCGVSVGATVQVNGLTAQTITPGSDAWYTFTGVGTLSSVNITVTGALLNQGAGWQAIEVDGTILVDGGYSTQGTITAKSTTSPFSLTLNNVLGTWTTTQTAVDITRTVTPPAPSVFPPTAPDATKYTAVTGFNPLVDTITPFNSALIPQADLAVSSTYYASVIYTGSGTPNVDSTASAWKTFTTTSSFAPTFSTAQTGPWGATAIRGINEANGYMYVGFTGVTTLYRSSDGTNWTSVGPTNGASFNQIAYDGSFYVAAFTSSSSTTSLERTSTGVGPWTDLSPGNPFINGVASNGSILVASYGSDNLYYSTNNGTSWTSSGSGFGGNPDVIWVANNKFFATNNSVGSGMAVSSNGTTWTLITTLPTNNLNQVQWTGSQYVFAYGDTVYVSTDSTTWTPVNTGTTGIAAGASLIGVAKKGSTLYLVNGTTLYYTTNPSGAWQSVSAPWTAPVRLRSLGSNLYAFETSTGVYYQIL